MKGVILAAGRGTRISESSDSKPKCLLEVGGRTILDLQLGVLERHGIEACVVVGYRKGMIEEACRGRNVEFVFNPFFATTNVLTSLWFARERLAGGFYIMNADTCFEESIFDDLVRSANGSTLAVQMKRCVEEDVKVRIVDGRIVEISKTLSPDVAAGEYIGVGRIGAGDAGFLLNEMDRFIEAEQFDLIFEPAVQAIIDRGCAVFPLDIGDRRAIEIDFPEDYRQAKAIFA